MHFHNMLYSLCLPTVSKSMYNNREISSPQIFYDNEQLHDLDLYKIKQSIQGHRRWANNAHVRRVMMAFLPETAVEALQQLRKSAPNGTTAFDDYFENNWISNVSASKNVGCTYTG